MPDDARADAANATQRATAFFYDDTAANFAGSGPRGKHPHVVCQRLTAPLSTQQLQQALAVFEQGKDPLPVFFFDFDGTLTLADGFLQMQGGSLERLFGQAERRRALQRLLAPLLEAQQVYVLTANPVLHRVEEALNALLTQGGAQGRTLRARFVMNETVRFVAKGDKLREIAAVLEARGLTLVPPARVAARGPAVSSPAKPPVAARPPARLP